MTNLMHTCFILQYVHYNPLHVSSITCSSSGSLNFNDAASGIVLSVSGLPVHLCTGSDNGKLNRKKRKIFKKYRVKNAREVAQLRETLKQNVQTKAQRIRRYKKGKPSIVRIRCSKKTLKKFIESWLCRI